MSERRLPTVYDADELAAQIRFLAADPSTAAHFYGSVSEGGPLCQGDVLAFDSPVPVIDEHGEVAAQDEAGFWLTLGNTCDVERSVVDVAWTQIAPLIEIDPALPAKLRRDLVEYRFVRKFYVPSWPGAPGAHGFSADLLRPVALHKANIGSRAKVVARISPTGWVLLHSCLVRFLCRDDGRFEP